MEKLEWVSRENILDKISQKTKVQIRNLDRGIKLYKCEIQNNHNIINPISSAVLKLIDDIKFIPLSFNLSFKRQSYSFESLEDLKDVVKKMTEIYVLSPVDSVVLNMEKIENIYIAVYTPQFNGDGVFVSKSQYNELMNKIKLSSYYGYKIVSDNSLSYYVVNKYKNKYKDISIRDVFQQENIVFLRTNKENILTIRSWIESLVQENYFVCSEIKVRHEKEMFRNLYIEIAELWRGKVKSYNSPMVIKSDIDFGFRPEIWYQMTAERILDGYLPMYTVIVKNGNENKNGTYSNKEIEKAYKKLVGIRSGLEVHLFEFSIRDEGKVGEGGVKIIKAVFGSWNDVVIFKQFLEENNNGDIINIEEGTEVGGTKKKEEKTIMKPLGGEFVVENKKEPYSVSLRMKSNVFLEKKDNDNFMDEIKLKIDPLEIYIPYETKFKSETESGVGVYVNNLNKKWKKGEFLHPWCRYLIAEKGKMSRIPVIVGLNR